MTEQKILEELVSLLENGNVTIRREPLGGGGGGFCMVQGESVFFLDTQAQSAESVAICAQGVANYIDVENIYIKPEVRQFIEKYTQQTEN